METPLSSHHAKSKRLFWSLCIFGLAAYAMLMVYLLAALFRVPEVDNPLRVDGVEIFQKIGGEGLLVALRGGGFDERLGAYLAYDPGNRGAIVATLPTWDHLRKVVVRQNILYMANRNRGFVVADISNPRHPAIIAALETPGQAWSVAVTDSFAYVATEAAGLQVIAIDDPGQPRRVAELALPGRSVDVLADGDRVFVATREGRIHVVCVQSPHSPRLLTSIVSDGLVQALALGPNSLLVAKGSAGVWEYALDHDKDFSLQRKLTTGGNALGVAVYGNELFVACGRQGMAVFALDGKGTSPVARVDTPGYAFGVAAIENRVFVADNLKGLQILERDASMVWELVAAVDTEGTATGLDTDGSFVYVVDGKSGLQVVSLNRIVADRETRRVGISGYVRAMVASEQQIYVAAGSAGIHILSIDAEEGPMLTNTLPTKGHASDLVLLDGRLYVADGRTGLQVLARNSQKGLDPICTISLESTAGALTLKDRRLVVVSLTALYVLETTDDDCPRIIGQLTGLSGLRDVAVAGDYAFVAAGKKGLLQISLRDPANPRMIGPIEAPLPVRVFANTLSVITSGDKLLVANARAGCQIYEVGNPRHPRFLTSIASMEYVNGVEAFAGQGYLFSHRKGVQSIDLETLQQIWSVNSSSASALQVVEDQAYVGQGNGGIAVIPLPQKIVAIARRDPQEMSIFIPHPGRPGRYTLHLTRDGQEMMLPEPLLFEKGSL